MDFTNRSTQSRVSAPAPQQNGGNVVSARNDNNPKQRRGFSNKWFKISSVILLFSGTILVVAVLLFINLGNPTPESKYINKSEYQAVFINANGINGGQVWFGHIDNVSDTYIHLTNVFYIQSQDSSSSNSSSSSSSSANNNYTLIKIGCELHGPEDGMTINRSQVLYWENLKSGGQVSQKIAQYYKQNPSGQNCTNSTTSNTTQTGSDANSTTSNNNATTPSSSSTSNTSTNSSSNSSDSSTKSPTSTSGQ